jgi:superfamily II DNA or RNA helicase
MESYAKFSLLSEPMKVAVRSVVQQVTAGSKLKTWMLWDELLLTLVNFPPEVTKELTFWVKRMETVNYKRVAKRVQEEEFEAITLRGVSVIKTHQGFWRRIMLWSIQQGFIPELVDLRTPDLIPLPKLGMMHGFRFSQEALLRQALEQGISGGIEAPTRFGKSALIINMLRAWPGVQTVLTMPGVDLLKQQVRDLREALPDREIKLMGAGSTVKFQSEDITVCSMDSLHKIDGGPVRLFIADEPHALIAESRFVHISKFCWARKYWIGATPDDRYDQRGYLLEGLMGPSLAVRTYREARAEGAVANIKAVLVRWEYEPATTGDRDSCYEALLHLSERVGRFIRMLSDWQTLVFIKTEKQADFLSEMIGRDVSVAMAKKLSAKERAAMTDRVEKKHITRALCSDIFVQGVTFHDLVVLINASGGGSSTSTIQKPGRVAEVRSGKSDGLLVDFWFVQNPLASTEAKKMDKARQLMLDSLAREKAYREKGYQVDIVRPEEVESWFLAQKMTPPDNKDGISRR